MPLSRTFPTLPSTPSVARRRNADILSPRHRRDGPAPLPTQPHEATPVTESGCTDRAPASQSRLILPPARHLCCKGRVLWRASSHLPA
jgi:hypothetical protein